MNSSNQTAPAVALPSPAVEKSDGLPPELVQAADAVVERWHSKDWKQPHTAEFINRLATAVGNAKRGGSPTTADAEKAGDLSDPAQEAYYYRHLSLCAQGQGFDGIASALTELDRLQKPAAMAGGLSDRDFLAQWEITKHRGSFHSMAMPTDAAIIAYARDILALRPTASGAVDLADVLSTMLWLYRRLPRAFGRAPSVEKTIVAIAQQTATEVGEFLAERDRPAANGSGGLS